MNLKDGEMHAVAGIVAAAVTAALCIGAYLWEPTEVCDDTEQRDEDLDELANCADPDCAGHCACTGVCPPDPSLKDKYLTIDAQLAFKAEEPVKEKKQPQKEFKEKEQKIDPEGVSRDDQKAPVTRACKVDADCSAKEQCIKNVCERRKNDQTAETDPLGKIPDRTNVDNLPTSDDPTPKVGAFDGSKFGRGPINKGDKWFGQLKADLEESFQPPEIARTGATTPDGCVRIEPDGKISDTKFRRKSDDDLQPLAEKALADLQRKRNDKPDPVPTHLLQDLTTGWICFNFTAEGAK